MAKRDGLRDPKSSYAPSGAGLRPEDDYKTPAGSSPEPASGSVDWRSVPQGEEEQ